MVGPERPDSDRPSADQNVETGAEREVLASDGEAIGTARLSPDGTWLYYLHGSASGDIWTVRFDHDSATEAGR